jgi:hypothetical protein
MAFFRFKLSTINEDSCILFFSDEVQAVSCTSLKVIGGVVPVTESNRQCLATDGACTTLKVTDGGCTSLKVTDGAVFVNTFRFSF